MYLYRRRIRQRRTRQRKLPLRLNTRPRSYHPRGVLLLLKRRPPIYTKHKPKRPSTKSLQHGNRLILLPTTNHRLLPSIPREEYKESREESQDTKDGALGRKISLDFALFATVPGTPLMKRLTDTDRARNLFFFQVCPALPQSPSSCERGSTVGKKDPV